MKHSWQHWLEKLLAGGRKRPAKRRRCARPFLETLEDRTLPTGILPFVQSINRAAPAGPVTNATSVDYTVTFNEPVTGVDTTDFQLALSGITATVSNVSPSSGPAAIYTVKVSSIAGTGTLGLNLVGNGSIHDIAGNSLVQPFSTSFQNAITYTAAPPHSGVTGSGYAVAIADVNGDHKPDLISEALGATISVLLGNGDGTFQNSPVFLLSQSSGNFAVTDVNGDNKPDLIIRAGDTKIVSVLLGNGDGSFQSALTLATAAQLRTTMAVADVNGDGKPELVLTNGRNYSVSPPQPNDVDVLLGNGDGTFQGEMTFATPFSQPALLAVADLNGDHKLDLVISYESSYAVSVLLGNGDGSFQKPVQFAASFIPQSVSAADVNGDGKLDLLVAAYNSTSSADCLLLGNGDGTFQTPINLVTPSHGPSIAVGDFNGDGKVDFVLSDLASNDVSVFPGIGDGTFRSPNTFAANSVSSIAVADLNNDGLPDLALSNSFANTVSVLLNASTGNFTGEVYDVDTVAPSVLSINRTSPPGPSTDQSTVTYTVTFNEPVTGVDSSDFNLARTGNVTASIAEVTAINNSVCTVTVDNVSGLGTLGLNLVNNGSIQDIAGNFLAPAGGTIVGETYNIDNNTAAPFVVSIKGNLPSTPITNDTYVIFTATFSEPVTGVDISDFQLALTGTTAGSIIRLTPISDSVYQITVGVGGEGQGTLGLNLVDNSSIRDFGGHALVQPNAAPIFQTPISYAAGAGPYSVGVGDVNGDNKPDLVVVNRDANSASVLLGNGDGTFQNQTTFATGDGSPDKVLLVDLNNDGFLDLAVANSSNNNLTVLLGNGDGSFQAAVPYGTGSLPAFLAAADLNNDGKLDLVTVNYFGASASVLLGNGNGTFQAKTDFQTGNNPGALAIADVNRDGIPDLIAASETQNSVNVLLGNGDGTFQAQTPFGTATGTGSVVIADFNGDGKPDIVAGNQTTNSVSVLLGNGDGTFQAQKAYTTVPKPGSIAVADINGDGIPDIVASNQYGNTGSSVSVLLGNGDGTFQSNADFGSGRFWRALAVADVNGDSRPDLIISSRNANNISVLLNAANGNFAGQVYTIDNVSPFVQSINRTSPVGPATNASSVTFTVTFSEAVTGVDSTDFKLATSGAVSYSSISVSFVSASTYSVTVNGIVGSGMLGLNLVDDTSIRDQVGHPLTKLNAAATFQSQVTYAVGTRPYAVAVGDVNGDGNTDIAVLNGGDSPTNIGILLGNGDGTFQSQFTIAAGQSPRHVTIADVNGDCKADLIIGEQNAVGILLGNGDGSFQNLITYPALNGAVFTVAQVLAADLNGDGTPDLTLGFAGNVSTLLGNGDGTFQSSHFFFHSPFLESRAGIAGAGPAIADVNGDGTPDLVIATEAGNAVLLGNGDGTFQLITTLSSAGQSFYTIYPVVGDVNGDGKPDIVDSIYSPFRLLAVSLGNGDGTFQAITTFAAGKYTPTSLTLADVNGDGKPDVVFNIYANKNSGIGVMLGNGNGTFQAPTTFAAGPASQSSAVADFNNDGRPDIAVANLRGGNTVSVLLNAANGNFTGQVYTVDQTDPFVQSINRTTPAGPGTNASSVTFAATFSELVTGVEASDFKLALSGTAGTVSQVTPSSGPASVYTVTVTGISGTGTLGLKLVDDGSIRDLAGNPLAQQNALAPFDSEQGFAVGVNPKSVAMEDVNGDGKADLAIANEGSGTVSVLLSNGNGTFQAQQAFTTGTNPNSVAMGDVNGDGKADLAVANYGSDTVSVLLGNGNGTFQAQQTFATGSKPISVAMGDVNGDSKADIVVANFGSDTVSVLLSNGNGIFQTQQSFTTGGNPHSVVIGEVNGDGIPDLAVADSNSYTVSVLLGNGNGTFQANATFATGPVPFSVAMGDINGDGHADLALANAGSNTVSVLLGNGNGTFQGQQTFATTNDPSPWSVAIGDLNGDGQADLAVANRDSSTVSLLLGNGDGTFQAPLAFDTGVSPYSVVIGDVNGDGKADLAVANSRSNTVSVLVGNGNGTFQAKQALIAGSVLDSIVLGDINGDGVADLAVANYASSTVSVLLGNGNGTFQAQQTFATSFQPYSLVMGDVNGDGKSDLAATSKVSNAVGVLLGNGNGTFQSLQTFGTGSRPFSVAIGDVNGDGRADLAVANSSGNSVGVLLGNGNGTFQAQRPFAAGLHPISVVVADVNGDGKADLVVANYYGGGLMGTAGVLLGNGNGTFQSQRIFTAGLDPISVVLGDLNGDGKPDLALSNSQGNTVSVLLSNGNGTFQTRQSFSTGSRPRFVALGDVNGDGKPDLVVANFDSASVSVLLGNGNGTFQGQQTFIIDIWPISVAIGDVNGDGRFDIAVGSESAWKVRVLLNTNNGNFTGQIYDVADASVPTQFVISGLPANISAGSIVTFTVTAEDQFNDTSFGYTGSVTFTSSDNGVAALVPGISTLLSGVGVFSATLTTAGNQTLTVTDTGSPSISGSASVQVTRGPMVSNFMPTPSGFTVTFDRPFDPSSVSMYTADATPDDVVLATSNTQVSIRGSLLFNADDTSITFVKTATPIATGPFNPGQALLSPGNYTLTLRSYTALATGGGTGFRDLLGNPLDGAPQDKAGSNYVVTFAVGAAPVAVGIPDFARGPSNTDALYFSTALHEGNTFNLSYTNHGSTGTATIAFSSNATTLTNNIQQALSIGGLSSQIGIDAGGVAGAVVVVTNDTKTGANALITFQGALATTTSQLLTSSTPGVNISTATINVPNNQPNSGIPIAISNAQNVTSGSFTLQYNPSLLTISGVTSKLTVAGATFTMVSNDSTTGTVVLSLSSPKRLSIVGTAITLGSLLATMPLSATAAYGAKQLLHFSQVQLAGTGGAMAATAVDAVQVASYFGDTLGLGGPLSLNDAAAILRVASGVVNRPQTTIPGFAAYPNLDPVIIGDVAIQGNINAADAGALGQESNGLLKITIPLAPIGLAVAPLGPDPTLSVPTDLVAVPGSILVVPVNIDTAHPDGSTGMVDAVLAMTYDPNVFEVSAADVTLGSVPAAGSGWQLRTEVNSQTGLIGVELHSNTPIDSTAGGSLITVTMHARGETPLGTAALTLVPYVDPSGNQRVYQTQVSDSRSAFVLEFATNAARTADVPITAVVENPIALAVLEQVFGDGQPLSTIDHPLTAYSPSPILALESGDRSHPDIRDLAVLQAPASADRAEEWLIENGSASLGQSPPRGRLDSTIELMDGMEAKSNHPDRVWWDEEKL